MLRKLIPALLVAACYFSSASLTYGQEHSIAPSEESAVEPKKTEEWREWRTARARYKADQSMLRRQYYSWIGYNPARPTVNSSNMMSSPAPFYFRAYYPNWYSQYNNIR